MASPKYVLLALACALSAFLLVEYLKILPEAKEREANAACEGMNPSPTNPNLGTIEGYDVPAIDFTLKDSTGKDVSLSSYRGKIVIVNFWASWCSVCRSEKPSLEKFQRDFADEDIVVLAVASDRDWAPVRRAMFGFEVAAADAILAKPDEYGVRDPSKLAGAGKQVLISRIDRDRAAHREGLHRLDRITSINGTPIENLAELDAALRNATDVLKITVARLVDNTASVKSFELKQKSNLRVLLDPPNDEGNIGAIAKRYGITAVPESFVIDPEGNVEHYYINKRNWDGAIAGVCMQNLIDG